MNTSLFFFLRANKSYLQDLKSLSLEVHCRCSNESESSLLLFQVTLGPLSSSYCRRRSVNVGKPSSVYECQKHSRKCWWLISFSSLQSCDAFALSKKIIRRLCWDTHHSPWYLKWCRVSHIIFFKVKKKSIAFHHSPIAPFSIYALETRTPQPLLFFVFFLRQVINSRGRHFNKPDTRRAALLQVLKWSSPPKRVLCWVIEKIKHQRSSPNKNKNI